MASKRKPDAFAALADPTRRGILALLAESDLTVKEIARRFPISRPAISKHLRLLRRTGLVSERQRGRERFQRFEGAALRPVAAWLDQYGAFWQQRLSTLKRLIEEDA